MTNVQKLTVSLSDGEQVSGLWLAPPSARACLVLAHGAGAGMTHKSMEALAAGLAERDIATLRYQFLYMERGGKRPDPPAAAHKVVRAAVAEAARRAHGLPLFAGGRSFGGRMTSQAQALAPLPEVRGLVEELRELFQLRQRLGRHRRTAALEVQDGHYAGEIAVAGALAVAIQRALDVRDAGVEALVG